jgi:hypothetical protein
MPVGALSYFFRCLWLPLLRQPPQLQVTQWSISESCLLWKIGDTLDGILILPIQHKLHDSSRGLVEHGLLSRSEVMPIPNLDANNHRRNHNNHSKRMSCACQARDFYVSVRWSLYGFSRLPSILIYTVRCPAPSTTVYNTTIPCSACQKLGVTSTATKTIAKTVAPPYHCPPPIT